MSSFCELESIEYEYFPKPIQINNHQFALVPSRWGGSNVNDPADGIYAYDTNINEWNKIIDYIKDITTNSHSALYHKQTNSIYVLNAQNALTKYDITAQKVNILHKDIKGFGSYPGFVLVGDEIHMFGAYKSTHTIYNCKENTLTPQRLDEEYKFYPYSTTYIKSKNIILIFARYTNKIHVYSLLNREWSEINVDKMVRSEAITAIDDKYIVVIDYSGDIYLYDIDTNAWLKSKIQSPIGRGTCKALYMDDKESSNLLAFGFVRDLVDDLLPLEVMNMIANWVKNEWLYLIRNSKKGKHYKIRMDDILNSAHSDFAVSLVKRL